VSHDIAALLQRPSKIVDGIAQASSARRDRLELEAGDQTIDGLGRLYGSDPARRAVIAEYRQFLGSSGKTPPPFHLVDVPIGGASLALSNRPGAALRLAPEIVVMADPYTDLPSAAKALNSPEPRVIWSVDPSLLDREDYGNIFGHGAGSFLSQLGCSPARLGLRVSSLEALAVLNSAFGTAEDRTPLGRRLDTFGNRDQVTIEVCGDSGLDPATLAQEYGLPVVDRRGTPSTATAPSIAPPLRYRPTNITPQAAGYSPQRRGRKR